MRKIAGSSNRCDTGSPGAFNVQRRTQFLNPIGEDGPSETCDESVGSRIPEEMPHHPSRNLRQLTRSQGRTTDFDVAIEPAAEQSASADFPSSNSFRDTDNHAMAEWSSSHQSKKGRRRYRRRPTNQRQMAGWLSKSVRLNGAANNRHNSQMPSKRSPTAKQKRRLPAAIGVRVLSSSVSLRCFVENWPPRRAHSVGSG